MNIMWIPPSDTTVTNSTNQYWLTLGLRCWSVYDTDYACNGGYWNIIFILYSGYPYGQYIRIFYPVLLKIKHTRSKWRYIWFMLNVCWSDNPSTEPSFHNDGLVARLVISTSMGNNYKYFFRIFSVLSNKFNRQIFIL